jgi:ubiquinone/menaquinone biosynthesis C-methylase UbiE
VLAGIERRLREVLGLRVQALPSRDHQEQVESHFDSMSSYWAEIYSTESVRGVIQQRRMAIVLEWIEELALPRESRILEVGCGAGLTTIELARRGYTVYATDSSRAMVERTLRAVIESDVGDRVKVFRGDVYSLPFEDDMFTSVFAMGVISWLESPDGAVREMAGVVKPGG